MTQEKLRVVVGSDAAGSRYKEALRQDFAADDRVAEVIDVGVTDDDETAYPHIAAAAARRSLMAARTGRCWCAAPASAWPSALTRSPASVR